MDILSRMFFGADTSSSKGAEEETSELPPLDQLLVSIDTAQREKVAELEESLQALLLRAEEDCCDPADYLRLAILVGFRRRNHEKALAPGSGAGEKRVLRTILKAVSQTNPELVHAVLPLVPLYGSWRDLQVLLEELRTEPLREEISRVFAKQLQVDLSVLKKLEGQPLPPRKRKRSTDEGEEEKEEEELLTISTAAKYCPHEHRHRGSVGGRRRKKPASATPSQQQEERLEQARTQQQCAKQIARHLSLRESHLSADLRKSVLAPLNDWLTRSGFLVEPHLCQREPESINFYRAPKGALVKYGPAIRKNPEAAAKWMECMQRSETAVPDLESLKEASDAFGKEEEDRQLLELRVKKAINTAKTRVGELTKRASDLLVQVASHEDGPGDAEHHLRYLETVHETVTLVVVDVCNNTTSKAISLLIAAFILIRAQLEDGETIQPTSLVVHGDEGQHTVTLDPNWSLAAFIKHVEELGEGHHVSEGEDGSLDLAALRAACTSVLQANVIDGQRKQANIILLCGSFDGVGEDQQEGLAALASEELHTLVPGLPCRALLVHRLRGASVSLPETDGSLPLRPRILRPRKPLNETVVDVAVLMDLTGSMGSYMDAAKNHLEAIFDALQEATDVKSFRVAFVGYRDYGDRGRVVSHRFVPITEVGSVVQAIRKEGPSGGGDFPEDVLSGVEALCALNWRADYRFVLHVADAPAHGYTSAKGSDYFPKGQCPDQKGMSLEKSMGKLKNGCGVDFLFCHLGAGTELMEQFFAGLYGDEGYGQASMIAGPGRFKDIIVDALSSSLLSVMTDVHIDGVQTFDGTTLSATISTLTSSLRESIDCVSQQLFGVAEQAEEDEEVTPKKVQARSDSKRLLAALNGEELAPVRIALNLPVVDSLLLESTKVLLRAGVTVKELEEKNYPPAVLGAMREAAAVTLSRI